MVWCLVTSSRSRANPLLVQTFFFFLLFLYFPFFSFSFLISFFFSLLFFCVVEVMAQLN